jgi:NDP-hexose 2,3-enoyl reductase
VRYRRLGRTALQVSELCLGTMNFGPNTVEPDAFEILDLAVEAGIDSVDTADQHGAGRWPSRAGEGRERIVPATKLYEPISIFPTTAVDLQ